MSMETVQWFISILFGVSGKISPNISFALENQRLGGMVRFPNNLFVVKKNRIKPQQFISIILPEV